MTVDLSTVISKERELMNMYAPHYRSSYFINSYYYKMERQWFVDWIIRTLRDSGRDPSSTSILEVGTATGDVLDLLAASGFRRLTGLDIAEDMLTEARRHVPMARLIHDSIEHHNFGDDRFDVVIATFTLHHMHDPREFFNLLDRVLAPKGLFFIGDYNAAGWENILWSKWIINTLVSPVRALLKWKNRHVLSQQPNFPLLFNPVHRLLSYQDILNAMVNRDAYVVHQSTRGAILPALNYALVEESSLDRVLYNILDRVDRVAEWFDAGNIQNISGYLK